MSRLRWYHSNVKNPVLAIAFFKQDSTIANNNKEAKFNRQENKVFDVPDLAGTIVIA